MIREYLALYVFIVLSASALMFFIYEPDITVGDYSFGSLHTEFHNGSMLFVGDIMLGRDLERVMRENGERYPYAGIQNVLPVFDHVIGNFEATVPQTHQPTPTTSLQFSVDEKHVEHLQQIGFNILSLANNHSFDYEVDGYVHTRTVCEKYAISCVGHPNEVSTSSIQYITVGDTVVGILFLHTLFTEPATSTLSAVLSELETNSEAQIVFVHWGEEYIQESSTTQQALAHFMVERGVDVVIGHHPHVIQEVERYQDKLIVYSLGNFIFDQYFSTDVQTGLMAAVAVDEDELLVHVIPIGSEETPAQPRLLAETKARSILEWLETISALEAGELTEGRPLRVTY